MYQKHQLSRAILKTLIYSDIFDYPLTFTELGFYLLGNFSISQKNIQQIKEIAEEKGYFFLKDRKNIVEKRLQRQKISESKLLLAEKTIKTLSYIPTIYFIGVSGSLAMHNADALDDIDLFIICSPHAIWITRLLVLFVLQLLGKRRKRNKTSARNAFCTNMFITKNAIVMPKNKQNLFTAHEIVQVKPMFDRENTYAAFFSANNWVRAYLPHAQEQKIVSQNSSIIGMVFEKIFISTDFVAHIMQHWYMNLHKTNETITNTMFAFHPQDVTATVLMEYARKLKKYGISV